MYRKGKLRFINKMKLGMASAAHSRSHELDGDFAWRTRDKPELHGENILEDAAATIPAKELPAQYSEPKELDSNVEPVELFMMVDAQLEICRRMGMEVEKKQRVNVIDGSKNTNQAVCDEGAQLKSALLSCKLTAVELIVELVKLIACLHEAYPHKEPKT